MARLTFNKLSNDADDVRMLQLDHDATFLLQFRGKLLVHGLLESFDGHVLHASVLVRVLTFQHLAVVTLITAIDSPSHLAATTLTDSLKRCVFQEPNRACLVGVYAFLI